MQSTEAAPLQQQSIRRRAHKAVWAKHLYNMPYAAPLPLYLCGWPLLKMTASVTNWARFVRYMTVASGDT
jgi:hypothetical protein